MRFHFTWDFILGGMKYFQFDFWPIVYNCLHGIPRNGTHCGYYFIAAILTETNLTSVDKCYENTTLKQNHLKGNICACKFFIESNGSSRSKDQNKNEFNLISPTMKTNLNILLSCRNEISFWVLTFLFQ